MKLEFSLQIFEKYISNFMKIHPVGAELFHAKRRTHSHDEVNTARRYSVNISNEIGFNWLYQILDRINVVIS